MVSYRKRGELSKHKGGSLPVNLLFWDTETFQNKDLNDTERILFPLKVGCATFVQLNQDMTIHRRKEYTYHTADEFIQIIESLVRSKTTLYCYAHHTAFDVMVMNLPHVFNAYGYETNLPSFKERLFIWDVKINNGKVTFLDTSQFGVFSVEKLGFDMGFDKLTIDFSSCTMDELITYCRRDVDILEKFVLSYLTFLKTHNLGGFAVTIASQSLRAFRTRFMHTPPFIHKHPEATQLERDAYYGGRTECFFIGRLPEDDYYGLDVNSMYPYAMKEYYLPKQLIRYGEDTTAKFIDVWVNRPDDETYLIADVDLNTKTNLYPKVFNSKLVFPIGRFRCFLHHHELREAVNNGEIEKVHRVAIYEPAKIFDSYVDFFYELKQKYTLEDNVTWRMISKLFLNSLYGKFGQLQIHKELINESADNIIERITGFSTRTQQEYQEITWFGKTYRESRFGETTFSFPALSGSITSIARYHLFNLIRQANIDNVFYCDTDSLLVNSLGFTNLHGYIDAERLGYLKLEKTSRNIIIYGNKDYKIDDKETVKGIPKSAKKLAENEWEVLRFTGFIRWLNSGGVDNASAVFTTKKRKHSYSKGIVNMDGRVTPFILS